mmetsp:Transcript_8903/g.12943  ORF Transcript_8903/g.12943 Transcript_8903/m.12943 type:complete len:498 (+) Transcript_8903:198-1691(+)|eukprot:CAMPEP_0194218230 /NCGR_PEP_ID=MMETSP0156-20130528/23278_1 /TAXON_ID=33649 /ORGANISM="Thalassionema nitzschioides, Strain L26-B" /LENGTH=497 /DNA_ID=CAMNT_0038947511 /DNA_START=102 /DNA_END=1595 /DNA_ORIENTATION=-
MSTSIPADSTLVLGQLIDPQKIEQLKELAEAEKPQNLAQKKLNNLILSNYKMQLIYNEMVNMKVDPENLQKLMDEREKLKTRMGKAAVELAMATIKAQNDVMELKSSHSQNQISKQVESPLNFAASPVEKFPFSADSMNFDVQYFRNETNEEGVSSHASSVASHVAETFSSWASPQTSKSIAESTNVAMTSQTSNHNLEGTIVIMANATHRQADIISNVVMDPSTQVDAWNATFLDDRMERDPKSMYEYVFGDDKKDNALHLLTGCSRGSSFVGFVHILRTESTTTSQEAEALASSLQKSVINDQFLTASTGSYGVSKTFADQAKSLLSNSSLSSYCSLVTEGIIASIVSNEISTTVQNLKPNPQEIMEQLSAIQEASNAGVNQSMEAKAQEAKTGSQFIKLNSEHLKNTVSALGEYTTANNKVIDTNSLMTSFTDYVAKAIAGDCGVPINFFIRKITKRNAACDYVNRFYPNGQARSQKGALQGQLEQTPEGGTKE